MKKIVWRRLRVVKRYNRNAGVLLDSAGKEIWWKARSEKTLVSVRRAFERQDVGGILYETVTGFRFDRAPSNFIFLCIRVPRHPVDREGVELCLHELGITLHTREIV